MTGHVDALLRGGDNLAPTDPFLMNQEEALFGLAMFGVTSKVLTWRVPVVLWHPRSPCLFGGFGNH